MLSKNKYVKGSINHTPKRIFRINVENIPPEQIDAYMAELRRKIMIPPNNTYEETLQHLPQRI